MVAAKITVDVLEKIAPKAVASLGKAGVLELVGLASIGAEGLNLLVTPIVERGGKIIKSSVGSWAARKKQELEQKKAALQEQQAQAEAEVAEEVKVLTEGTVEKVEEKPKTSKKKGK